LGNAGGSNLNNHHYGENSNRGRIPLVQNNNNNNNDSSVNLSERKNPMTVLLGSVNASLDS
jgi:hypothetical protein